MEPFVSWVVLGYNLQPRLNFDVIISCTLWISQLVPCTVNFQPKFCMYFLFVTSLAAYYTHLIFLDLTPWKHLSVTLCLPFQLHLNGIKSISLRCYLAYTFSVLNVDNSIVNTNTCTTSMSLNKIYLKFLKNTPTCFAHSTIIREFFSCSLKSLLSTTLWIFLY